MYEDEQSRRDDGFETTTTSKYNNTKLMMSIVNHFRQVKLSNVSTKMRFAEVEVESGENDLKHAFHYHNVSAVLSFVMELVFV